MPGPFIQASVLSKVFLKGIYTPEKSERDENILRKIKHRYHPKVDLNTPVFTTTKGMFYNHIIQVLNHNIHLARYHKTAYLWHHLSSSQTPAKVEVCYLQGEDTKRPTSADSEADS